MAGPFRPRMLATVFPYIPAARSKSRLNQPKKPPLARWWPFSTGFSRVAQSAGVSISATTTDSAIDETRVIENWR